MPRALIVYSHPNPQSFCHAIKETAVRVLAGANGSAVLRDLYAVGFDPILSGNDLTALQAGVTPEAIATEQAYVREAQLLVFIYPIWWAGLPAMMKGYIDRVFTNGFAFRINEHGTEGLLGGKRVMLFTTAGATNALYEATGMEKALRQTSDEGIFRFCGMEVVHHALFGSVTSVDDTTRQRYLAEVEAVLKPFAEGARGVV